MTWRDGMAKGHTSSQRSLELAIWGSTEVDVREAPGKPVEYGDTFPDG